MAARAEPSFSIRSEVYIPVVRQLLQNPKRERSQLGLIVVGESGLGKSSLVNGLLGWQIAKEGHTLKPETVGNNKYSFEECDVDVILPGTRRDSGWKATRGGKKKFC